MLWPGEKLPRRRRNEWRGVMAAGGGEKKWQALA